MQVNLLLYVAICKESYQIPFKPMMDV